MSDLNFWGRLALGQRRATEHDLKRRQLEEVLMRARAESERVFEPVIEEQMGQLPGRPGRPAAPEIGAPAIPGSTPSGMPLRVSMPTARAPNDQEKEQRLLEAALRLGDPAVAAQLFASTANQRNRTTSTEGIEANRLAEAQRQWAAEGGGAGARPLDLERLTSQQQVTRGNRNQADKWGYDARTAGVGARAAEDADALTRQQFGAPAAFFKGMQDVSQAGTRAAEAAAAPDYYRNRADAFGALADYRGAKTSTENQLRDPRVAAAYEDLTGKKIENDISWEELGQLRVLGEQKLRRATARADEAEGLVAPRVERAEADARRAGAQATLAEGLVDPTLDKANWQALLAEVRASVEADLGRAQVREANADATVAEDTVGSRIARSEGLAGQAAAKQAEYEVRAELDKKYSEEERSKALRRLEAQTGRALTEEQKAALDLRVAESYANDYARLRNEHLESKIRKNNQAPSRADKLPEGMKLAYDRMITAYYKAESEKERQEILEAAYRQLGKYGIIVMSDERRGLLGLGGPKFELAEIPQTAGQSPSGGGGTSVLDMTSGEGP